MQFRCPNCQQQIRVDDSSDAVNDETQEVVKCPSCDSQINLMGSVDESTNAMESGTRIGHFEIQQVLGEGSFGAVYKAWDTELQRHVAIKIPRAGQITKDSARLFLREARSAASISHPNVVGVHEVGQHGEGYYIACQYIEGITLRDFLRAHKLAAPQSAELLIKLLRAMQVFHDKGIIHRDLKPGNVLLDTNDEPFIADFGLARRENPDELTVTQSGRIVGTLLYMSPEQARGEVRSLTTKTDIYSMGVILYEMLTGERPFQSTSSQTVLYHIMADDPRPPRKINKQVPLDIQTICLKALEKEPNKRYATAVEMADDLQRFIDGRPILARPASTVQKAVKLVRRNRLVTTLAMITVAALAAAGVAMQKQNHPEGSIPVMLNTDPPGGSVKFVRYHDHLRIPHHSEFTAQGYGGDRLWLMPGLYKVLAHNDDGRRHEVWRFIPEATDNDSTEQRFPHQAWTVTEDKDILLQPVTLFSDNEVSNPMVKLRGGTFMAGFDNNPAHLAALHQQLVTDFELSVNEVSYGQFRTVMNQPLKSPRLNGTYLSLLRQQFGDRSETPDDLPVSGYPVDVAILYCELAGGRLPTQVEWEFAATQGGKRDFPSGDHPVVEATTDWSVLKVSEPTADTTPEGIRNLFSSVAEYTDSRALAYSLLYRKAFVNPPKTDVSDRDFSKLPEIPEVRGAPASWLYPNADDTPFNVRARLVAPFPKSDSDAVETYGKIGWRLCRSR